MMKLLSVASVSVLLFILPRTDHPDAATLGGRVTDENLVAIANATISAGNVFTREIEFVKSDTTGLYRFTGLRQGRYSVLGKAEGHGSTWVFNVFLFRGQHTQLDLMLPSSGKEVRLDDGIEIVRDTK